jgi:hypothetical protein
MGGVRRGGEKRVCPRGRWVASAWMPLVRLDASVLSLGKFIADATMRPSHG